MYRWKIKNISLVLLNWLFYRTETTNKCVWLRMARFEIVPNWKLLADFFNFWLVSQIMSVKTNFSSV